MLTRSGQLGEFYIMGPPSVKPMANPQAFVPHQLDMVIYDEERDMHVRVTWEEAVKATLLDLVADNGGTKVNGQLTLAQFEAVAGLWSDFNKTGAPTDFDAAMKASGVDLIDNAKDAAVLVLGPGATTAAKDAARAAVDSAYQGKDMSMVGDIRIVVTRPFIEHTMHSAILTVSGRDTGATLFGPSDMQLSANTQVKTIEGCTWPLAYTAQHSTAPHSCTPTMRRP
jgi:hypothetical protein